MPLAKLSIAMLPDDQLHWQDLQGDDEEEEAAPPADPGIAGPTTTDTQQAEKEAEGEDEAGGADDRSTSSAGSSSSQASSRPRRRRRLVGPLVRLSLQAVEPSVDPVWRVAPASKRLVKAFRDASFRVSMRTPDQPVGPIGARLVLDAEWQYSKLQAARCKGGAQKRSLGAVRLLTSALVREPLLSLDKRAHPEAEGRQFLKFEVSTLDVQRHYEHQHAASSTARRHHKSSSLSSSSAAEEAARRPAGCMTRAFALTNPTTMPLTFTLHVPRPFKALAMTHANASRRRPQPGTATMPTTFTLGPHVRHPPTAAVACCLPAC